MSKGFTATYEGRCLGISTDTEAANEILYTGLTIRQRLDVAHLRIGWPILEYDDNGLEQLMLSAAHDIYLDPGMDEFAIAEAATD